MKTVTIACPKCAKAYRVDEKKLPAGKKIVIPCPNCRAPIRIDGTPSPSPPQEPVAHRTDPRQTAGSKPPRTSSAGRRLEGTERKKRILQTVQDLPPMPQIVSKARKIMSDPNSSMKELTSVIENDQAIASRMVKLANSAYYGLSGRVSSVRKATTLLGQKTLQEVLMTAGCSNLLDRTLKGYGYDAGDLWRHSVAVALGSKIIAELKRMDNTDEAYFAGLIHDAGKLVLDPTIVELKTEFDAVLADESQTFLTAEQRILGFDHADIAYDVCRKWQIPDNVATAVRYHHAPSKSGDSVLAYIVSLADHIARSGGLGYGADDHLYDAEKGAIAHLGLNRESIMEVSGKIIEAMIQFQK